MKVIRFSFSCVFAGVRRLAVRARGCDGVRQVDVELHGTQNLPFRCASGNVATFSLSLLRHACALRTFPLIFESLEMSQIELAERVNC